MRKQAKIEITDEMSDEEKTVRILTGWCSTSEEEQKALDDYCEYSRNCNKISHFWRSSDLERHFRDLYKTARKALQYRVRYAGAE